MSNILNEERLIQAANRYVGSYDFYHEDYRTALGTLLTSLNQEASLSKTGMVATFNSLLEALTKQFFLTTTLTSHPEIAEIPIERPVFITGFPRSGTTLLHNLLAQDYANRTLQLWEMYSFSMPTREKKQWEQEQIVKTERFLEKLYQSAPIFKSIHSMQATWPDECNWLFRNSFSAMIYAVVHYIPNYLHWLLQQNMESAYTFYKRQLQFLLWRSPGQCLVLKDPFHLWHLKALLKVFPDARIIHLHRNISESLPSLCSLSYTLQGICSDRQSPSLVGMYCQKMITEGMKRMFSVRSQVQGKTFIDISYYQLIHNPLEIVESIYKQLGWNFTQDAEATMRIWLTQNKQHKAKTGRHLYSLEQFGLDYAQIQENFSDYSQDFLKQSLTA